MLGTLHTFIYVIIRIVCKNLNLSYLQIKKKLTNNIQRIIDMKLSRKVMTLCIFISKVEIRKQDVRYTGATH